LGKLACGEEDGLAGRSHIQAWRIRILQPGPHSTASEADNIFYRSCVTSASIRCCSNSIALGKDNDAQGSVRKDRFLEFHFEKDEEDTFAM
jgi:hypothetical protein